MDFENLPLQPLRIPQGWTMSYNCGLYEIEPNASEIPESESWWIFKEDMVQLVHKDKNRLLDLGWYPEGELENGKYRLELYEGDFTGELLHSFSTQSRSELVEEIERILQAVSG